MSFSLFKRRCDRLLVFEKLVKLFPHLKKKTEDHDAEHNDLEHWAATELHVFFWSGIVKFELKAARFINAKFKESLRKPRC